MTTTTADADAPPGTARALWEFTRPHTVIGTSLAVLVLYVLAAAEAGVHDLAVLAVTWAASLLVNVYIVGLNQLTDVEIDRINKPYLPLAAGAFSRATATWIVGVTGVFGLSLAAWQGPWLFATLGVVFTLGTVYSLPPLRLKRSPFWAAAAITLARAVVGNCGVYLTYSAALSSGPRLPPHVLLFVGFMFVFVVVIAVMKDIPDIEGDRQHAISTLVTRLGAARTLLLCRLLLTVAYLGTIVAALGGIGGVEPAVVGVTHAVALAVVWGLGARVDPRDADAVYRYYMVIWKLFYLEFVAFPAAALLR